MIVAKTQKAFTSLKLKFQKHQIQKVYIALVYGKLKNKEGIINAPIMRSKNKFNRRKISLDEDIGKEAITKYEVMEEYENTSLIKAYPKTGRTHQIRVHLSSLSNFVIGDNEYGSSRVNKQYNITRQFLHSSDLSFLYKKQKYHFVSKLPNDLSKVIKQIKRVD
jgi:23S rRNA pseudouridine1911/1915/1917 synthase